MFGGLRKVVKTNPLADAIYPVPPALSGGVFFYGRIGSGKSVGMKSIVEKYHDHPERRYKVLHLWGGDRNEQLYWALPSRDLSYWSKIRKKFRLREPGPKQYKVNILYPMTRNLPDKLPFNPPFVNSKVFTIPIRSITTEDISLVIDNTSQTGMFFWREAVDSLKGKDNGAVLDKKFKELGATKSTIYRNFISPMVKHRFLASDNYSYNLDLKAELKDRETITILSLDFLEKDLRLFVLGWMLRQIAEMLDGGEIRAKNIIMIQEAAEFFRATDESVLPARYKIFRKQLAHFIRMGRRGMHLFLDAQSPRETRGMVDGSQDLTILGKLPSEADRTDATLQLYKDNLITKKQIQDLAMLSPGQYYISEISKRVRKRYFFLPRTMYWKPGYGNFYSNVWKNLVDKWVNIRDDTAKIEEDFQAVKKALDEQELIEKALAEEEEDEVVEKPKTRRKAAVAIEEETEPDDEFDDEDDPEGSEAEDDGGGEDEDRIKPEPPALIVQKAAEPQGIELDLW